MQFQSSLSGEFLNVNNKKWKIIVKRSVGKGLCSDINNNK